MKKSLKPHIGKHILSEVIYEKDFKRLLRRYFKSINQY